MIKLAIHSRYVRIMIYAALLCGVAGGAGIAIETNEIFTWVLCILFVFKWIMDDLIQITYWQSIGKEHIERSIGEGYKRNWAYKGN